MPDTKIISIHALREEGDCYRRQRRSTSNKFLSTPSARRATVGESKNNATFANFYPRPPRGGRLTDPVYLDQTAKISIHALREEGDGRAFCYINDAAPYFYPRPPRGGRRQHGLWYTRCAKISIHALREEGDPLPTVGTWQQHGISIHALREEGDVGVPVWIQAKPDFYPRPPRGGRPYNEGRTEI